MCLKPYIFEETGDFAIVFKPPCMHCVPLKQKEGDTLFDWYAAVSPAIIDSGGLVHRLDFETQGLVLFAKNRKTFDFFQSQQKEGNFVKEYDALCAKAGVPAGGFPPPPEFSFDEPFIIQSFFRPFGPGRKQVRPVTAAGGKHGDLAKDRGSFYRTEILHVRDNSFTARISRGFRHQIRCHLCWIGYPILNDPLYGAGQSGEGDFLALRSHALFFTDPESGLRRECRITDCQAN